MKNGELIQAVTSAYRERDERGVIQEHPGWHDLGPQERRRAFEATLVARRLEAAVHPDGLSSTAEAVLRRIRG
ncbi:hypothetical protein Poly30_08750 [Planctomycetes bacterium Poly30]|uniref:Uncharacterized protein n=1 Tax=Saltatorellus ferox TaxID=2528018 RepID=A0A518EMQ8_9BACT|nr:hypothetical protein Poly30_08750 [Planctomycetes bacterium Poly30]